MAAIVTAASYKYQFVSEPDDALKCLICLEVAEEPWQHGKCGRLFCEKCLEKHGKNKPCPNCRLDQPQYLEDGRSKREIKALPVKCDNAENKCEWVGTAGTLQKHLDMCQFVLVPCPSECKDENNQIKTVKKKELDEHLKNDCPNRDYTCEYCGKEGTYTSIVDTHYKICFYKILPCPNDGCTATIQRQHVIKHVRFDCEHTRMPCKYRRLGCETELKRKDMAAHEEDDKLHLHMAMNKTMEFEKDLRDVKVQLEKKFQNEIAVLKEKRFTFKFTDYQEKKISDEVVESPSYYFFCNGYHMGIRVYANGTRSGKGTYLSVFAHIVKGKYDKELNWPFSGNITLTLLNQLEDSNHLTRKFTPENMQVGSGLGYIEFIPHSELGHDPIKNTQYLKDDTLYFRMIVEAADRKPWLE